MDNLKICQKQSLYSISIVYFYIYAFYITVIYDRYFIKENYT